MNRYSHRIQSNRFDGSRLKWVVQVPVAPEWQAFFGGPVWEMFPITQARSLRRSIFYQNFLRKRK
jgi:hypothetical protein